MTVANPALARANVQGKEFERVAAEALRRSGAVILYRNKRMGALGLEADLVARIGEAVWWIECKGSWLSSTGTNGLKATNTVKRAVAVAALQATSPNPYPFMLITSDVPSPGTLGERMLLHAQEQGWIQRVVEVPVTVRTLYDWRPHVQPELFPND